MDVNTLIAIEKLLAIIFAYIVTVMLFATGIYCTGKVILHLFDKLDAKIDEYFREHD